MEGIEDTREVPLAEALERMRQMDADQRANPEGPNTDFSSDSTEPFPIMAVGVGGPDDAAAQGDDRALEGPLEKMPVVDVLQLLYCNKSTGQLHVEANQRRARIEFKDGFIVGCEHPADDMVIGKILVEHGAATAADVQRALEVQKHAAAERQPLVQTMLIENMLSREDGTTALEKLVENTVAEIMSWREGYFIFQVRSVEPADDFRHIPQSVAQPITLDVKATLVSAMQIIDERSRDDRVLPQAIAGVLEPSDDEAADNFDALASRGPFDEHESTDVDFLHVVDSSADTVAETQFPFPPLTPKTIAIAAGVALLLVLGTILLLDSPPNSEPTAVTTAPEPEHERPGDITDTALEPIPDKRKRPASTAKKRPPKKPKASPRKRNTAPPSPSKAAARTKKQVPPSKKKSKAAAPSTRKKSGDKAAESKRDTPRAKDARSLFDSALKGM